jgi:hypothetical protein
MGPNQQPKNGFLARTWQAWKRIAKRIGNFQARVLMAVFYFTIFCPFALAIRWGSDPLGIKPGADCGWRPILGPAETPLDRARKQF